MTPTPEGVLGRLPDWRGAACSPLHGGLSNRAWLLEKDGRKAVLKIDDAPRTLPFNSREAEAVIQARAARAGLANRVLYADATTYIAEYVEGEVWNAGSLTEPDKIEELAAALRRLHALPVSGRLFDSKQAAAGYARRIDRSPSTLRHCMTLIDALPAPRRRCLCHNDLVAENILSAPEVRFLDWEYACDNDPLFDLAVIAEHHGLDEATAAALLDAYFEGAAARRGARFEQLRMHYAALLWLWLASRPQADEDALRRAGQRLRD